MRKAIIRYDKKGVLILCNRGHYIDYKAYKDNYAGSMFAAEVSFAEYDRKHHGTCRFDRLAEKCQGAGH